MKANRSLLLFLSLATGLTIFLAAGSADALPQSCDDVCSCSAECSTVCNLFGWITTCGDELAICRQSSSCSGCYYKYGGSGDDTLNGTAYNDCIYGYDGHDTIHGNAGEDRLYGGNGNDSLYGDSGDDRCLDGGPGWDYINGGSGADHCIRGEAYVSCEYYSC